MKITNHAGRRYGRLVVICRGQTPLKGRNAFWLCRCDCGNMATIAASNLKATQSCGCFQREAAAEMLRGTKYTKTHGMSRTPEHSTWLRMRSRCHNPNHKKYLRYGGRGIKVCTRWADSFEAFLADMGARPSPRHSIDRKDNDGDYTPDNCRWATPQQQASNKSDTRIITIDGISHCLAEWCRLLGFPKWKIYDLTKSYNANPPRFTSIEAAIEFHVSKLKTHK